MPDGETWQPVTRYFAESTGEIPHRTAGITLMEKEAAGSKGRIAMRMLNSESPARSAPALRALPAIPRAVVPPFQQPKWTAARLSDLIRRELGDRRIIVVSNREPYLHRKTAEGEIECISTAGGLATALRPVLAASGGTWIAHGAGDADRDTCDAAGRLAVPPGAPSYTLRRVWLTGEQEKGYYYGLANEGLWPLCHLTFNRPVFREEDWEQYREVNRLFAEAVLEEAGDQPALVFIQDYHFALLPGMLKEAGRGNLVVAQFWHIPWPDRETMRVFPWAEELLHGLTGNDLIGFHIRSHCQNFLDTADRHLESRVDRESWTITRGDRTTMVRPFPISIDFAGQDRLARSREVEETMEIWRHRLGLQDRSVMIGIGIERMDYTKGIPDRLRALDCFFGRYPEWRGKVSFVQIAAPSRSDLPAYQVEEREVAALAAELNRRWGTRAWTPFYLLEQHHSPLEMAALHRLSRFMVVNALHDGMNLVAKEYCASRTDHDGVLILSRFTGACRELKDALEVNPYAAHEIAEAIRQALVMGKTERARRMRRMRAVIARNNVFRWAGKVLAELMHFDLPGDAGADRYGDALD